MGLMHNAVICHRENNMLFISSQLGTVEVDESTIINFDQGIPALENCTQFKLFHNADSANPSVFWMQSLDDAGITLSVTHPTQLGIRYEVELNDEEVARLELSKPEDAVILVLLYQEQSETESHPALGELKANIRNPLILNLSSRKGLQKTGLSCDILMHNLG